MPEHPNVQNTQAVDDNRKLRIFQINLNKSERAHLEVINDRVSQNYNIMLIQEPHTTTFNAIRTPSNFRPVFPAHRIANQDQIRSVIWVNNELNTNRWTALDIPDTNDITAIQLRGPRGAISIFNIYNDCTHSRNETTLRNYIQEHSRQILATENHHMIWAGDFNRHHPLWDNDEDVHLFTQQANRFAQGLIDMVATYDMNMALPKGTPTLQHMVTKRYSRPDNFFNTTSLTEHITKCEVDPTLRPSSTDHFPILTDILIPQKRTATPTTYNFREADWDNFRKELRIKMNRLPNPPAIDNSEQLTEAADQLTKAIQETIGENIRKTKPRPDAKRWWSGDLKKMKRELNRLRANSYRFRASADHPSHDELRTKNNQYGEAIIQAKRQHWKNYLEEMTAADIWTANKFIKEPAGDGGCPRIPALKIRNTEGIVQKINENKDKADTFARTFFPPPPPPQAQDQAPNIYPEPLPDPPQISKEQIGRAHV